MLTKYKYLKCIIILYHENKVISTVLDKKISLREHSQNGFLYNEGKDALLSKMFNWCGLLLLCRRVHFHIISHMHIG